MYLIILESGDYVKTVTLSESEYEAARNRFCDLIDISDPQRPLLFVGGNWEEIASA